MFTKVWKIYGADGHRQAQSFGTSEKLDLSNEADGVRVIEIGREDVTDTNDYVIIRITRNTEAECDAELNGQIDDGIFENCRVGAVEMVWRLQDGSLL